MSWSSTAISGYNATPPADDGSQTASNVVSWATIKTKLTDPLKTAAEANVSSIAPFLVPTGGMIDFAGSSAPTGWLLCYGQAVSRSTYADLFAVISTTYGVGDGSSTFNVPDCRDRVSVGKADMGGSDAGRISLASTTTLGDTPGAETLPAHTHTGPSHTHDLGNHTHTGGAHSHGVTDPGHTHGTKVSNTPVGSDTINVTPASSGSTNQTPATTSTTTGITVDSGGAVATGAPSSNVSGSGGTGDTGSTGTGSHGVLQPGIVFNRIIKT